MMPYAEETLISVVLCTYNRCQLMAAALKSVCEQTLPPSRYEVVVVDNNSSDGTRQHVGEVSRQYPHVRYCFEARQGLSHGRNAGFQAARGRYIAYIDDDCTVPKEWLDIARDVIERVAPALFGGPYTPFYNSTKPRWYRDSYGAYDGGPVARRLGRTEYLSGTNLFIRRVLLTQLGGFSIDVGMVGDRLGYGEETVFQRRVYRECPEEAIYYEPRLTVFHLVRSEKMTLAWCAKQMFVSGRDWQRVLYETTKEPPHAVRLCLRGVLALFNLIDGVVRGMLARNRSHYPFAENYLYEVVFVQLQTMGAVYERFTHRAG
jgi:glycosyltransferase involved in cell wall biosynthesis